MIKSFAKLTAISAGVVVLSSCVYETLKLPVAKEHSHYRVVIAGTIKHTHLQLYLRATYAAYNHKCNITTNWIEGIKSRRTKQIIYQADGVYQITIPIDKYILGRCDWKISAIDFKIKDPLQFAPWITAITFGSDGTMPDKTGTLKCKTNIYSQCTGDDLQGFYTDKPVSRFKNYYFKQNIKD